MKKIILLFCLLIHTNLFSQLPDGSIAPNFIAYDLNGEAHCLYDILDSGKDVIIDFFFTSCNPCWNWHNSGILEELYETVGPEGNNEAVVLMLESKFNTNTDDIYGIGPATSGDWTEGTSYPILEYSNAAEIFKINSFPTILKICQDRRIKKINGIRFGGVEFGLDELNSCPDLNYASEPFFIADKYDGCGSLAVQFEDQSWPRPTAWFWDFGDGTTATEQSPLHLYTSAGTYTVSLTAINEFGENQTTKTNLIKVGEGEAYPNQLVGGVNSGSGYFDEFYGGRKLKFDVYDDLIISSVKVYSDKHQERTFVLKDESGTIIQSTIVDILEGEHRIPLNFYVPSGQNFQLGLCSESFLRIDSHSVYPYLIEDLISIKGHSGGSNDDRYYFFYEWEVRSASCLLETSVSDFTLEKHNLYPNPTNGILTFTHDASMKRAFSIFNISGQKTAFTAESFEDYTEFDLSKIPDGVYFLEALIDDQLTRSRFVKK